MEKTAFLFPGQGSQYPGMGQQLYVNFPQARQLYDAASQVIGFDLLGRDLKENPQAFFNTTFGQPAILALSVIAHQMFADRFGEPAFYAGHSLGEYSALICAGALDFHDGLKIVQKRAQIMESMKGQCTGGMSAIDGCSVDELDRICQEINQNQGTVVVSNYNSLRQCVISGSKDAVKLAGERASASGGLVRPLNLDLPFHSPLLAKAVDLFEKELKLIEMRLPRQPVISNVTAMPYQNISEIRRLLAIQIMQPVKWLQTMAYMVQSGLDRAVEFGPKQVLKKFFNDSYRHIPCVSVENDPGPVHPKRDQSASAKSPAEVLKACMAAVASTKNNDQAAQPKIDSLYAELKMLKRQNAPTCADAEKGKRLLREILELKKASSVEIESRFKEMPMGSPGLRGTAIQLFCFPYAGGSANLFKEWPALLPKSIQALSMEYPGRGHKFKEPLSSDIHALVAALLPEIEARIDGPFALFGHSLGAVVAYETAKALKNKGLQAECLILSGCPAPGHLKTISSIKGLSDEEFLDKIASLNGTPPELLSKEEFRRFFIPILRSDFSLLDDYASSPETGTLDIPLVLYGGESDPKVSSESIRRWSSYTKESVQFQLFAGDHFYIKHPEAMLKHLTEVLFQIQGASV